MAVDNFAGYGYGLDSPAANAAAVTPSDSADLDYTTRGLFIGVDGDVAVYMTGTTTARVFKGAFAGSILPIRVDRVLATDTTATDIVALW